MKKIAVIVVPALILFAGCGGSDNSDTTSVNTDQVNAELAWSAVLTEEEQFVTCEMYRMSSKEEMIAIYQTEPNPMSDGEANAFYNVLEDNC